MPKFIDITGNKYNKLTVVALSGKKTKANILLWDCLCDCGKIVQVSAWDLKTSHTKSCGCHRNKYEDLSGKRFGRLSVIERVLDDSKNHKWKCLCDCGNTCEVTLGNLKNSTASCGCLRTELLRKDLVGNRYGRLVVLERAELTKNDKYKWKCQCDCGKVVYILGNSLQSGRTPSCGCQSKEANLIRLKKYRASKGKDPNVSMLEGMRLIRANLKLSGTIQKVLKRDEYSCCLCNRSKKVVLAVHHIVPLSIDESLALEEANLVTLCKECHKKAHKGAWCWIDYDIQTQLKTIVEGKYVTAE